LTALAPVVGAADGIVGAAVPPAQCGLDARTHKPSTLGRRDACPHGTRPTLSS